MNRRQILAGIAAAATSPRVIPGQSRPLTPAQTVTRIYKLFAALTGASVADLYDRRRGAVIDLARNLAGYFLYEVLGCDQPKGWLTATARAAGRHYSTMRASALKWDWRRGVVTERAGKEYVASDLCTQREAQEIAALFDWLTAHWREPLSAHRDGIAKRRTAFKLAVEAAQKASGLRKLAGEEMADALLAMARVVPIEKPPASTAVPIVEDEPVAVRMLRQAPAFAPLMERVTSERARDGGYVVSTLVRMAKNEAARTLSAMAQFLGVGGCVAQQRGIFPSGQAGWCKAVLHAAAAAIFALSPLVALDNRAVESMEAA